MSVKTQRDYLASIIQNALDEALANTHTSTIAKVTKVNDSTLNVKPVFKRIIDDVEVELPVFIEVPIITLQGGSNYRIMPIAVGDTALLVFSERCIDDWYFGADNKKPREYRMHDYSDAIAIVGLNNLNNAITIPQGHERVNGDIVHTGNVDHTGNTTQEGNKTQTGNFTIEGDITVTGNINLTSGDIVADGISLKTHVHGGVVPGGALTLVPQ